jgi:hypothetical protein
MSDHTGHPCPITLDTHVQSLDTKNTPQTQYPSTFNAGQKVGEQDLLTNTINNNRLSVKFYSDMVNQYGKEAVDIVVVNLEKMNGEVKNFPGYVRSALKNGYVPTNKTIQEKEKSIAKAKLIDEKIEKDRLEREEMERLHEESKLTSEQIKEMFDQVGKGN